MIATRQDDADPHPTDQMHDEQPRPSVRRPAPLPATLAGPAIPLVILLVMGYRQRWVSEDAFISLRVVDQILAGNGPVYNESERVEAYTHPLWVAILTVWGGLGLPTPLGSVILGIVATLTGVGFAMAASTLLWNRAHRPICHPERKRRISPLPANQRAVERSFASAQDEKEHAHILVPVGALIFAVIPVVWDFVTSGLETGLSFAWLGVAYWLLVRASLGWNRQVLPAAFVIGLGPLVRPDLAIFAGVFLLCLIVATTERSWRGLLRRAGVVVLVAGAVPVVYQVFRMGYFAAMVPNTALAKEAEDSRWEQGWIYLRDFVDPYSIWLPLLIAAGFLALTTRNAWQRFDWIAVLLLLAPVGGGLLYTLYVVRVGGDFMHGRFLLPALFGLLLPVMLVQLPVPPRPSPQTLGTYLAAIVLAGWSVVAAVSLRIPYEAAVSDDGIADERGVYVAQSGNHNPIELDDYMGMQLGWPQQGASWRELATDNPRLLVIDTDRYPLDPTLDAAIRLVALTWNTGLSGYAAGIDVHVTDRYGLADPLASRLELNQRGRPGHEKQLDPIWAIARFAEPGVTTDDVATARKALACGDIAEQLAAIEEPLSASRFIENIGVALRLRDLSIPADPETAVAEHC